MASRLAKGVVGAARLQPSLTLSARRTALPAYSALTTVRSSSSSPNPPPTPDQKPAATSSAVAAQDPKSKAQSILDALPGNSLVSKTAILSSATALSVFAISNEYYVVNEETVVAFCLLSVWAGVFKYIGPMYKEWAEAQNEKIKNILNAARADHVNVVKNRLEDVKQMAGVVEITKSLFEVSKETAKLEAQAYELEQRTALAAEAKATLDSWVRYESQIKQRQQKELAETVIAKVQKELENPKVLQQILQQSVAEVEKIVASKAQ